VEAKPRKVAVYQRPGGTQPFVEWMRKQDKAAISEIIARLNKVRRGAVGDYDDVGEGILELRFIGAGPGYRIYCADDGRSLVLLLCGGIKRSQRADIQMQKNSGANTTKVRDRKKNVLSKTVPFDEILRSELQDREIAVGYVNALLSEEDEQGVLLALRDIADAMTMSEVAKTAGVNRESLYKMLSGRRRV